MKLNLYNKLKNIKHNLVSVVFPSRCLLCGGDLLFSGSIRFNICDSCYSTLIPISGARCEKCSMPLISEKNLCTRCRDRSYHFKCNTSVFRYIWPVKDLIYYYKFKNKQKLAQVFSAFIGKLITSLYPTLPLICVPARKKNIRKRGWDHLIPIVKILKKNYGIKVIRCLERRGDIPQKTLSFDQRIINCLPGVD